jgi:Zierdtviridae exonuclease
MQELRTSERKSWGACPQQWAWGYRDQLTPKRTATALWFGIHWHDALAQWYRKGTSRGEHPAEYLERAIDTERKIFVTSEEEEDDFMKARELAVAMGEGYVEEYGKDEQWEILAVEADFAVIFKNGPTPYLKYLFCMDGLYRDLDTGQIFILEHKTAQQIRTNHLRLDNQAGSYYALAPIVLPLSNLLRPEEKIAGIQYNFARKAKPNEKPRNKMGQVTNKPTKAHYVAALKGRAVHVQGGLRELGEVALSRFSLDDLTIMAANAGITVLGEVAKVQPAPYFVRPDPVYRTAEERETQISRIRDEAHYIQRMREGDPNFPVIKTPGDHCGWCPFRDMCELDEYNKDAAAGYRQTMMTTRDPYEQYRKVA